MSKVKKKFNGKVAATWYGWMGIAIFLCFIWITYRIVVIKYAEGEEWRKIGEKHIVRKPGVIIPNRGNIYGEEGKLLATSIPKFKIYVDFVAEGVNHDTLAHYIDTLSYLLATNFPGKRTNGVPSYGKSYYRKLLTDANKKGQKEQKAMLQAIKNKIPKPKTTTRRVQLIPFEIDYLGYNKLKTFPYFKLPTHKNGLYSEERTERLRPFGNLAGRTVGSIHANLEEGGRSGMELKYDSVLRGVNGIKTSQRLGGEWISQVMKEPEDGKDILITVNVDYQDITEKALYKKLQETKATSGCAIIMEVKTGEIKAISNLDKIAEGIYAEGKPNAYSYLFEPGSTFKTVSLLIALEDDVVTPETIINAEQGKIQYAKRWITDHDSHKGRDKTNMTVTEGMANSSNVLVAKMILRGYENQPEKFVEKIRKIGLGKNLDWDVPLQGREGKTNIRSPKDSNVQWSKTALPWMSFGYETQIPPVYMLMFYNAIANKGKMIKPFVLKAFMENGKIKQEFKAEVINPSIASASTLRQVNDILRYVVDKGTGSAANSKLVNIAGKTGTTKLSEDGVYGRNYYVSFAGYFPAENPKYTCYVGIERPVGIPSGGGMAGGVFREIAEKITIRESVMNPILPQIDTVNQLLPNVHSGVMDNAVKVLNKLNIDNETSLSTDQWAHVSTTDKEVLFDKAIKTDPDRMPNVIGMGMKDAVYILELQGLQVSVTGYGKVIKQSISAGTAIRRGNQVNITLRL